MDVCFLLDLSFVARKVSMRVVPTADPDLAVSDPDWNPYCRKQSLLWVLTV